MNLKLGILLLAAFLIRIYNINYNTLFIDEAQYITVGMQILSGDIESGIGAISWVGGLPFMYPFFTALFYEAGGTIGSRLFTVILGTVCVFLVYQLTKQLLLFKNKEANQKAGLIAGSFMAVTTIAVASSRLAIYDGLAFTLFLAGLVLFHKALYAGERKYYLSAALVLFLSFLAKYIVVIFFPFFFFVPIYLAVRKKSKECIRGIITYFCIPFLLLMGSYVGLTFTSLQEFFVGQEVVSEASPSEVIKLFSEYTLFSYILSFIGVYLFWDKRRLLVMALLFFSFIPLIVHAATNNTDSVQQHTFLSIIFILPLVGAMIVALIQKYGIIGKVVFVAALVIQIFISVPQVMQAESFWPNLGEAVQAIEKDLTPNDRILGEAGDSLYLELKDKLPPEQFEGPFVFTYAGQEGVQAYIQAINDGYFKYVQLEGTYFSEDDIQIIKENLETRYRKIFDNGSLQVYKLNS